MKSMCVVAVFVAALFCVTVSGHTYHSGECPRVEPMSEFQMGQFLGVWYGVQKTSTASSCIAYNISRGEEPGEYYIEQISQHFALGLTPLKHEYSYTGQLTVPDGDVPAKMRVKFPLNVGSSSFTVFLTDYTQFAGIFTCQKLTFAHRQSATLLSRERTLDKMYTDKLRTRLGSYGVDPFSLSIINQTGCPSFEEHGFNIHIDPNTFSASNIANGVRKAGEKIGDGVEYALNAGKKAYGKLFNKDDNKDDEVTPIPQSSKPANVQLAGAQHETDAEWVPL